MDDGIYSVDLFRHVFGNCSATLLLSGEFAGLGVLAPDTEFPLIITTVKKGMLHHSGDTRFVTD